MESFARGTAGRRVEVLCIMRRTAMGWSGLSLHFMITQGTAAQEATQLSL